MAKVLLIQPHSDILNKEFKTRIDSPLSLIVLATFIKKKHKVKIYDRNVYPEDNSLLDCIKDYAPDIVGITSTTSLMLNDLIKVAQLIKKTNKKITLIVGGVHATIEPQSLLDKSYVDYVLRGEGEEAFLEFCDIFDKDKSKLKNIKNINLNPLRPLIDMKHIPIPDYSLIEIEKYQHFYVMLSRGCVGSCTFCSNHKMWGKDGHPFVRMFSLKKSIKLFDSLINKYHINNFSLMDDNFLVFPGRVKEICNYLENKEVNFYCFGRADYINDDILRHLKKAGCHTILVGIESGSQRILNFLNKKITVQQNKEAILCIERNGITIDPSVMIGIPTETKEDLQKTINLIKETKPSCTDAQIFNPMPGTPIFEYCLNKKLLKKPESLEEWANWTGNRTFKEGIYHNVSKMSDEEILNAAKEIRNYRILLNKFKRFVFWIKKGQFKQATQSSILFIKKNLNLGKKL